MELVQNEFGMQNLDEDFMDKINLDKDGFDNDVCFVNEFDDLVFEDDILLF